MKEIPEDKKKRNKRTAKWNKENMKLYALTLHKVHDAELIEHIEENKPVSTFLKKLVRKDLEDSPNKKG